MSTENRKLSNAALSDALRWRYATKQFDPSKKISLEDWAALEEALVLTPSSYGMQPWKFVVVSDPAVRESLVPASWGQRQVADASHLVVFAIRTDINTAYVDRYMARIAEVRGGTPETYEALKKMLVSDIIEGPRAAMIEEWAARQAYIALGNFMTCASVLGIDTCPLEGFEPAQYDAILDLPAKNLKSVVAAVAGYRSASDKYASLKKVRFDPAELFVRI